MKINGKRYVVRIKRNRQEIRPATVFAFFAVACLPFHTLTVSGVGLLLLIGFPLLVLSIPALLSRLDRTAWDPATLLLAAFFAYNILGYLWTPSFSAYSLYNYVKIIVIVMSLYCQAYNKREKNFLLFGSLLSCLIVCWFMLTGSNIGYTDRRMTVAVFGVEQDPNYLGYLFIVPMAISVQQFLDRKRVLQKAFLAVLGVLILFCVMMTGSRGALLGIATVVAVCVITHFKKLSTKIVFCVIMALFIVIAYGLVLSLLPEHIAERFSIQLVLESRGTGRVDIWFDTFRVMKESPFKLLFGFGAGSSISLVGWATHNFFLQLLLELGIVGLGLFMAFLWVWTKRLAKEDTMGLSIVMGCMAMAMTLSVNTIYYFWLAFILGIVCSKARSGSAGG